MRIILNGVGCRAEQSGNHAYHPNLNPLIYKKELIWDAGVCQEKWKESEYRSSRETEKNNWEKTSYTDGSKESGRKKSKFNKAAGTESGSKRRIYRTLST